MARSRFFFVASLFAVGAAGCAHCDTCDNMPVPCSGPGCSAALRTVGSPMDAPSVGPFSTGMSSVPMAPPSSGTSAPLNLTAPALPDVPADAPSPPPGPAALEKP